MIASSLSWAVLYPQVDSEQDCSLRVSSKARGMKIFVPGFRALYDTAKGPDSGVAGGLGIEFGSHDYVTSLDRASEGRNLA